LTKYITETQIYTSEYIFQCTVCNTVVSTVVQYSEFVYLAQTMTGQSESWKIWSADPPHPRIQPNPQKFMV